MFDYGSLINQTCLMTMEGHKTKETKEEKKSSGNP